MDKDLIVEYEEESIYLSSRSRKGERIKEKEVPKIKETLKRKLLLEKEMQKCNPYREEKKLKNLFLQWRKNEFLLQELWGYEPDLKWHKEYTLPHCSCPEAENEKALGTNYKVVSDKCVLHLLIGGKENSD